MTCNKKQTHLEPSTIRGLVWVAAAIIGLIGWWSGKDVVPVVLLAAAVAGGLGVAIKDHSNGG